MLFARLCKLAGGCQFFRRNLRFADDLLDPLELLGQSELLDRDRRSVVQKRRALIRRFAVGGWVVWPANDPNSREREDV
ncbi:hypothetical protein Pla100_51900 [Neorhodopirellula pilleata]|uniref:Uncharacterized protein n=1 Tax=Neorhodopirellula pilleata TaxID=2714738 RepID=A0A5C5ZUY7_9BACT|nr:hypothetical protein Pla100_51900 [Neorhodopirellula pilleata]